MFKKGFVVFYRSQDSSELLACPVLSKSLSDAREEFLDSRAPGTAQPDVLAVLSLEDLDRHRRSVLKMAQERGVDLTLGGK